MRAVWIVLTGIFVSLTAGVIVWLREDPAAIGVTGPAMGATVSRDKVWRLGLVPERDVFAQRKRYRTLAEYLEKRLGKQVELVTVNSYDAVLKDMADREVDFAFLGSLLAVMAMDRHEAEVVAKPVLADGVSQYRGIVLVREDSPIRDWPDLAGKRLALLRTTYAGDLFPVTQLHERKLLGSEQAPKVEWAGTHEEVIRDVVEGIVDAGAVKDLVYEDLKKGHPEWNLRVIARSPPVPNLTLLVRRDLVAGLGQQLHETLLRMEGDQEGMRALSAFGAQRFVDCQVDEFSPVYDMLERLGEDWVRLNIEGPAPRRENAPRTARFNPKQGG